MHCAGCNKPLGSHIDETCHINFDTPKTYEDYLAESYLTNESLLKRYGAPPEAKPPTREKPPSDKLIRAMLFKRLA